MEDLTFIITPMSTFEALHASLSTASQCIWLFLCILNLSKTLFQLPNPSALNDDLHITKDERSFCCFAKQHTLQ